MLAQTRVVAVVVDSQGDRKCGQGGAWWRSKTCGWLRISTEARRLERRLELPLVEKPTNGGSGLYRGLDLPRAKAEMKTSGS